MKKILFVLVLCLPLLVTNCRKAETHEISIGFDWTATGDDGVVGQATGYEMKYSMSEDSLVTHWNECTTIPYFSTLTPKMAGQPESESVILDLEFGTYYFALKVFDDVGNYSDISNIKVVKLVDDIAPFVVTNLNVYKE